MSRPEHRFTHLLSEELKYIESSKIREILALVETNKEIISFAGGLPADESIPVDLISKLTKKAAKKWKSKIGQYGTTEGVRELREAIIKYMAEKGITVNSIDEVVITAGAQQGIQLCGKTLLDPGDELIVADPTYLAALSVWKGRKAAVRDVNIDSEGMIMSELERKLKQEPKPKFIYDVPTFGNPSGVTMTEKRRKWLIDLLEEYNIIFVEDDPYSELIFDGDPVPPVKSFDTNDNVIYLGTFSKIFAPGLRVGFAIGHKDLIREFVIAKQGIDLCTSTLNQYICTLYLTEGHLSEHLPKVRELYKKGRDAMLSAINKYFPKELGHTYPKGGMFIWINCPEYINTSELLNVAVYDKKVAYVPGKDFEVHGKTNGMRLNYSYMPPEQIKLGIQNLGELLKEKIDEAKTTA